MKRETKWIYCPFCRSKIRIKIADNAEAKNFLLYSPKCKHEVVIDIHKFEIKIKEPDAKMQSQ